MVQKCSNLKVLEVFFREPSKLHFIKRISKRINLAHTSVRKYIKEFAKQGLIKKKKARPFNGYVANRDNKDFIFYKRVYNLYSLKNLKEDIIKKIYPKLLVVFGSYARGEDMERSDIDLVIISKEKQDIKKIENKYENKLKRNIHAIIIKSLNDLSKDIQNQVKEGIVLYGGFE